MLFRRKQEITHADTTVRARAKINLTLDVTGRREDGYHHGGDGDAVDRRCTMTVRVTTIHGEKKPRGIVLELQPAVSADRRAQSGVPCGGAVLQGDRRDCSKPARFSSKSAFRLRQVWRAARRMRRLCCVRSTQLHYSRSDATTELCEMGLKLGADVPFCLRGGTMLARGHRRGADACCADMPHCWVVLCKPPFAVLDQGGLSGDRQRGYPRASGQQGHDGRAQSGRLRGRVRRTCPT